NLAAEKLRAEYEEKLKEAELEKDIILEDAGKQAKTFLDDARSRVHGLLRSIREHLSELERLKRRSVKDCQKAAEELAQTLLSSDDLEIFASLSPVASKYLASALLEAARRRYPDRDISRAPLKEQQDKGGEEQTKVTEADLDKRETEIEDHEADISVSAEPSDDADTDELPVFKVDDEAEPEPEPEDLISVSETPERADNDSFDKNARDSVRAVEAEIADLASQAEAHIKNAEEKRAAPNVNELVPGCRVYVHSFGQEGTVVKAGAKRIEVQMGVIRMQVKPSDVEIIAPPAEQKSEIGHMPESRKDKLSIRVDLQGKTVDEAIYELSYRIDEAYLNNIEKLEIIHGKGTGTLRRAITEYVKQHPMVAEFRLGEVYEGGLGVTVVRLK
nr:Smr/MutS family protein [bacterium]